MLYCGLEDWKASLTADHDAPTLIQHLVDSYAVQPQVTAAPTPALSPQREHRSRPQLSIEQTY